MKPCRIAVPLVALLGSALHQGCDRHENPKSAGSDGSTQGVPKKQAEQPTALTPSSNNEDSNEEEPVPGLRELSDYYRLKYHDSDRAFQSLIAAARKWHPEACRLLGGYLAWDADQFDISQFGDSEDQARVTLMSVPKSLEPNDKWNLANLLADGSEDVRNLSSARVLYGESAEGMFTHAWYDYAEMCRTGRGGEQDLESAYFWLSASAAVVHAESFRGEQIWERRIKVSEALDLEARIKVLHRFDAWKANHGDLGHLGYDGQPEEQAVEGRQLSAKLEKEHRIRFLEPRE